MILYNPDIYIYSGYILAKVSNSKISLEFTYQK